MIPDEHPEIWLQPWCANCENTALDEGRMWAQDCPWDDCECGAKPVRYVIAPQAKAILETWIAESEKAQQVQTAYAPADDLETCQDIAT